MTIIKNTKIRDRWHKGYPRNSDDITEIVIHATAGGGFIKWLEDYNEREKEWKKGIGLVQYHINKAGLITEIIDVYNWVYHSSSGSHDKETIGIEVEKLDNKNASAITVEQAESLLSLTIELCKMFPTIKKIVSHDYNRKKYSGLAPKPCPGEFPWATFSQALGKNEITKSIEVYK